MNTSEGPVRYFNGEVRIVATDVVSQGYGRPFGHTRTYSNQQYFQQNHGNGYNWTTTSWPYLSRAPRTPGETTLVLCSDYYNLRYFDQDPVYPYIYHGRYGDLGKLRHFDAGGIRFYQLNEADGTIVKFKDLAATRPGGFLSQVSPGGDILSVTQETSDRIVEIQRNNEFFAYEYGPAPGILVTSCTLRIGMTPVTRCLYTYENLDLRTATRQVWSGESASSSSGSSSSGADGWQDVGTDYYRYYANGDAKGSAHDLKFACGPEAFARLAAHVADPFTASDAEVAQFADFYYEYDSNDRVTLERIYAGSKTITFSYDRNPRYFGSSSSSGAMPDSNVWFFKTTETQPDGTRRVVYANKSGQTMLSVLKADAAESSSSSSSSSGMVPQQWCTFFQYDDRGRQIRMAMPSAVMGYNELYDDLLNFTAGKYQYLRDDDGLISYTQYYKEPGSSSSSSGPNAAPVGYIKTESLQRGQLGALLPQRDFEYTSNTDANGTTIFLVSKEIRYPDPADFTKKIETGYLYTFHTDTNQIAQQTTILPTVSSAQNGIASGNRTDVFDLYGYRTWNRNERGVITRLSYNIATGSLARRIDDVDTSLVPDVPPGWTTPTGGGLNLVTDYEGDLQGRITQELGPTHTVSLNGSAVSVRRAIWTVYDDHAHTVSIGQGYATGSSPGYAYTLINPVQISQHDHVDRPLADIQAVRASTTGRLLPTDSFAQSSYTRWQTYQYTDCCLLESQRRYHHIPASGEGAPDLDYDQTTFGYDSMKRRNRVVTPGGTILFTVYDDRGLPRATYIGTNDTGATESDPTHGGVPPNDMVLVSLREYDNNQPGGDGNLTRVTLPADAGTNRITDFGYDWRDRLITTEGEEDLFVTRYYDNLSRMTKVERRQTNGSGTLLGREETLFDDLNRIYRKLRYAVNPSTGAVGEHLTDNFYYDATGNLVRNDAAGSTSWTMTQFDTLNRPTAAYRGYGNSYFSPSNCVIVEQNESLYDNAGNLIQTTLRQRYHDAPTTQTGGLGTPSSTPHARVMYAALYPDPLGRVQAQATYGTNGGTALSRSATIPSRSESVLIASQTYDDAGNLATAIDPAGMLTRRDYDALGRVTQVVENEQSSSSSSSSSSSLGATCPPSADANRTTNLTYTADGKLKTLQAVNASTGNQTTEYVYGTTLTDSDIASSLLLRSVKYPGSVSGSDQVWLAYNRQGQRTDLTDQNGSAHAYDYDLLGRVTQDRVTTLGTNVDGAIRRIETAYEVRGMVQRISSWTSATVGGGTTANEVRFGYNDFGQPTISWQAHAGAVDTMTTPKVQRSYADGSANTIRPLSLTYPNGRVVGYDYGASSTLNDRLSRIASIIDDDDTHLADYEYLGASAVVQQDSPEADLRYTLISLTGSNDPDTGDIYAGLDRFSRVKDVRWRDVSAATDLSRVQYGYNRASSRTWRANPTDPAQHYDWLYGYDGLQRVKNGTRGTLNGTQTAITTPQFAQCWTLDETGNWQGFRQDDTGDGTWDLLQSRTANPVNEITNITANPGEQWATPVYDPNGNMTTIPRPRTSRKSWANLSVDDWSTLTVDEWAGLPITPAFAATYDAWNRLTKLADVGTSQTVQENQYDGRGYRTVTQSYTDGALTETRHAYYTDQWQCVEERLGSSTTPDRHFVWGIRYIDDLIFRNRSLTGVLDERLYACQDANWNTTAVIQITGLVQERYEYDAYGTITFLSPTFAYRETSSVAWETTYCGYRCDAISVALCARLRFYIATTGTWCTRDALGAIAGGNRVEYVNSRPLNAKDAFGLKDPLYTSPFDTTVLFPSGGENTLPPTFVTSPPQIGTSIAGFDISINDPSDTSFNDYFGRVYDRLTDGFFGGAGSGIGLPPLFPSDPTLSLGSLGGALGGAALDILDPEVSINGPLGGVLTAGAGAGLAYIHTRLPDDSPFKINFEQDLGKIDIPDLLDRGCELLSDLGGPFRDWDLPSSSDLPFSLTVSPVVGFGKMPYDSSGNKGYYSGMAANIGFGGPNRDRCRLRLGVAEPIKGEGLGQSFFLQGELGGGSRPKNR